MDFDLTTEQKQFREVVHNFVAAEVRPRARHTDETGEFNWAAVHKMGPLGMLGLQVPAHYGGAEVDSVCATIAIEELGWACGSTALAISAQGAWNGDGRSLSFLSGTPPTSVYGSTSRDTTAPAATTAPSPIVTPGRMMTRALSHAWSPIVTGAFS